MNGEIAGKNMFDQEGYGMTRIDDAGTRRTAECTAQGAEPYDMTYGLGYQVGHGDLSPYPRVNRLRAAFFELPFAVDVERARLVTEVYRAHPERSARLNAAYALEHVLENATLYL